MHDTHSTKELYNEPVMQKFGIKHVAAFLLALAITAAIFIFRGQIRGLEQLGYLGVFLAMLLANATLFLPTPTIFLAIAFGAALPNPLLVGLAAGLGSAIGETTGYLAGYAASAMVTESKGYKRTKQLLDRFGLWAIAGLAFIPNPIFDMAGLAAGALGVEWGKVFLSVTVGKTLRMLILAYTGSLF